MKNNDSFKINVVSSIDDEIIDRASKERDRLLRRPKVSFRKKLIAIGSLAAMVIMVFSGILFFNSDTPKQIPIYTGMSISDTNPMLGNGTNTVEGTASSTLLSTGNSGGGFCNGDLVPNGEINKDSPFGDGRKPIDEVVSSTVTQSGKNEMYYAKPGDDIYITVHIDNPDGFEILSFTLNGKKYTSYMFEYGSDLENLILKVNVGEASGVIDYTVDQIKYIDGTEIKDVKMEGDKTVSVGIYSDNQPGAILSNRNIAINSVSFKASITDELGLIGLSNGKVQAILYDGESIVSTVDITVPNQEITFTGLKSNTLYQYAIVFIYDKLDGEGVCAYTYLTDAFYTKAPLLFDNVEVTSGGASFEYVWYNGITERVIKSASLYSGDDKVKDIPTNALSIDGLLSDTRYTLVVMYENGGVGETIKLEFETKTKAVPDIQVTSPSKSKNSISFSVSESDTDGVGSIVRVELLRDNNTVAALEGEVSGEFINLLSGTV